MGYWKFLDTASAEKDFEDDYNVIVQNAFGVGTPPHNNIITPFSLADGGNFQRTVIQPRIFTLQCATKTTTVDAWHTARKDLFDQLKRDRGSTVNPVTIRYDDGTTTLDIEAYYDGGLEVSTLEKTIEKFAIRFVCPDPFWKASSTSSTSLNNRRAFTNTKGFVYRDGDGDWNNDGPAGASDENFVFGQKLDGNIIVAGHNENIYEWDGATFSDIGTITAASQVYGVAVDAADNVFIVGSFTDVDSVTARRIAKWNGSAWSEPATNGLNNTVYDIKLNAAGNYVICGDFTADGGGGGTYRRIATVNASTGAITEISPGLNSSVYSVVVDNADNYYFAGAFTADGGGSGTYRRLVKYDGSSLTELNSGLNGNGNALVYDRDANIIYLGGAFTADGPGTKTLNRLASIISDITYDMNASQTIGQSELALDTNGVLYFVNSTNNLLESVRGSTVVTEDLTESSNKPESIFIDASDRVWVSSDTGTSASLVVAGKTTVNNTGLAVAYPSIAITGPGTVYILRNYTTNASVYFNAPVLHSSEILTIDFAPGVKTVTSNLRGNMINYVKIPSDLATFALLPGNNEIALWVDSNTASVTITWTNSYWSIDGVT